MLWLMGEAISAMSNGGHTVSTRDEPRADEGDAVSVMSDGGESPMSHER